MKEFFELLLSFFCSILNLFNSTIFLWGSVRVSLLAILFAFLVTGMVISIFWRGAKT